MTLRQEKAITELVAKGGSVASAMRKAGYSAKTARTPKKLTQTAAYQEEIQPIVALMEAERMRLIAGISKKNLSKEKYRDMIEGIDKLTKNIQLLSGGKTANEELKITWGE